MKKKTKAQREAELIAALRKRIGDIYAGACWEDMDKEDAGPLCVADFGRVITAIKERLLKPDSPEFLSYANNAYNFDSVESATEFLFRNGVRA